MAKPKSEWPTKVMALVRSGNIPAAIAQIKVAPTLGDLTRLQKLIEPLPATPTHTHLRQVVAEEHALLSAPRLHRAP